MGGKMKIILIVLGLLLMSGSAAAYNVTTGLESGEIYYYMLYTCEEENELTYYMTTPTGTYIYDGWNYLFIRDVHAFATWYSYTISYGFDHSIGDIDVLNSWKLITKTYNETTEVYEDSPTDTEYIIGYVMEITGGAAGGATSSNPSSISITSPALSGLGGVDIVSEYFINNTARATNFNGINRHPTHPDYVEVQQFIGDGMVDIERVDTYGVTMTREAAQGAAQGISGLTDAGAIGFSSGGRGAGAGSGGIYEGISLGGEGDHGGIKPAFETIFYILIPLIFVICILKFSVRMFGG